MNFRMHQMAVFILSAALIVNISLFFAPLSYAEDEKPFYPEAIAGGRILSGGEMDPDSFSRFYIVTENGQNADPADIETAEIISDMLAEDGVLSGKRLSVVSGKEKQALPGDIVLIKSPDGNPQAYKIEVTDRAVVSSSGSDGLYYGMLSLMEILVQTQGKKLQKFYIEDEPDTEERAVFLDCGRKYFSSEWIKAFIRRSSFQRYNTLILHFSEAEGLRLDSEIFPWLTENIESLSRTEMADIVNYAGRYHMKIVPSFDTPGHNQFIVSKYREHIYTDPDFSFEYAGRTYGPESEGFGSIANYYSHNGYMVESDYVGIDITNSYAVAFMDALIDDYAAFFRDLGCKDFDIGGDEVIGYASFYLGGELMTHENRWSFVEHWAEYARNVMKIPCGSANDTFIFYLNHVASRLMRMGYDCRVFNDEIDLKAEQNLRLRRPVGIAYWNANARSAKHYTEDGYRLYNCVSKWCYYAVGTAGGRDLMYGKYSTVNSRNIYENWDPASYSSREYKYRPIPDDKRAGAYFCIWCDNPDYKSDEIIWSETELLTWANATKMWNISLGNSIPEDNPDPYKKPFSYSYEDLEDFVRMINESGLVEGIS